MPQRETDTDRVLAAIELHRTARAIVWTTRYGDNDPDDIWTALARDAERWDVAALIEWHAPLDGMAVSGPIDDVTVSAATGGVGVRWRLAPADGTNVGDVYSLSIHSLDGNPVGQRLLNRLGLGKVHTAVSAGLSSAAFLGERWGALDVPRPGRRGRGDLFYARAALDYVRALDTSPRAPVRYLLEQSDEHVTGDELRARLRRARERDLLTAAPKGQPGGELTEKAKALLRDIGEDI